MDGSPKRKESVTTRNIREQYAKFINADAALVESRRWIERATFTPFKNDDFRESLADGVLLCELIVNIFNISVGRINKQGSSHAGKDNLSVFFRACEALGLERYQLFDHDDLQEVSIKRGHTAADRARESQKRLGKVALTIYWLGKYAKEQLNSTGRLVLDQACFTHLLEGAYPTLPEIEPPLITRTSSSSLEYQPLCERLEQQNAAPDAEKIVVEKVDFREKREAFRQLEEQARQEEKEGRQRTKSFSGENKENKEWLEEVQKRRKSVGSKTVFREGDCKFKHKREILGGRRDPIRVRRERILQSAIEPEDTETSPKAPVHMPMHAQVNLRQKKKQYEQMERQASEEADVLQGKRLRPKSWAGGDFKLRSGSLKDRTTKYEDLQSQADKETSVLRGIHCQDSSELYDIGDKPNTVVPLPSGADVKLRDKKRQFENMDYKAQRESSILTLHSGKSFDSSYYDPIPLSTSTRRAEPKPRPKSEAFDYLRYRDSQLDTSNRSRDDDVTMEPNERRTYDIEMREEEIKPAYAAPRDSGRDLDEMMNDRGERSPARSLSPVTHSRGDSMRYSPVGFQRKQADDREASRKHGQYSSFTATATTGNKDKPKEMRYEDFVVPPVVKQKAGVERYNAALEDLAKEPEPKTVVDHTTGAPPRRKSRTSSEWIKVSSVQQAKEPSQKPIKKLWDREPLQDSDDENKPPPQIPRYDKPAVDVSMSSYTPDVRNMKYKDFAVPPSKPKDDVPVKRTYVAATQVEPQQRSEPFKRFTAPVVEPSRGGKPTALSYKDFAVPPAKVANVTNEQPNAWEKEKPVHPVPVRKRSVRDISSIFTEMEREKDKPKPSGPPPPKSLVDREELVRYERESRARSWYGGPMRMDDEEYDDAFRGRVRRWSDNEYEEEGRRKPSPYNNDSSYYEHKSEDVFLSSEPSSPQTYPSAAEPGIKAVAKPVVETSREWNSYTEDKPSVDQVSFISKHEPHHESSRPLRSILKMDTERATSPTSEPVEDYYHAETRHEVPEQKTTSDPVADYYHAETRHEVPEQKTNSDPVADYYHAETRHEIPEPKLETSPSRSPPEEARPEVYYSSVPAPQPEPPARPPLPNYRAMVGRSWQDFESSRRKKSMELLHRPTSRVYETNAEPARAEVVKLRRPADYIPKHHGSHELLNERPTSPTSRSQPSHRKPPEDERQYYYESKPHSHDHYPHTRTEDESRAMNGPGPMPTAYPTYYEPQEKTSEARKPMDVTPSVETGKALLVNAKLHGEGNVSPSPQRRSPSDDFIVAEKHHVVKSQPEFESRPRSTSPRDEKEDHKPKLDVGDYSFRPRSPLQHTWKPDIARQSPPQKEETFRAISPQQKDPEVKDLPWRPRSPAHTRQPDSYRESERASSSRYGDEIRAPEVQKQDYVPQVFAIVGQGRAVRPVASEVPKPMTVSIRQEQQPSRQSPRGDSYYKRHEDDQIPQSAVKQAVHDVSIKMEEKFRGEELNPRAAKTVELDEEVKARTFELRDDSTTAHEEKRAVATYDTREGPQQVEITATSRAIKEDTTKQDDSKSPPRAAAKVFDFRSQSPTVRDTEVSGTEPKRVNSPSDLNRTSPAVMREKRIVVEDITPVEKEPVPEVDVMVLEKIRAEDQRREHSLRDADYRAKLRKEVEETNRKQREEARYLTNQMQASLGSEEDLNIKEEQDRLRQEGHVSLQQAEETQEPLRGALYETGDYNVMKREEQVAQTEPEWYLDHPEPERYHDEKRPAPERYPEEKPARDSHRHHDDRLAQRDPERYQDEKRPVPERYPKEKPARDAHRHHDDLERYKDEKRSAPGRYPEEKPARDSRRHHDDPERYQDEKYSHREPERHKDYQRHQDAMPAQRDPERYYDEKRSASEKYPEEMAARDSHRYDDRPAQRDPQRHPDEKYSNREPERHEDSHRHQDARPAQRDPERYYDEKRSTPEKYPEEKPARDSHRYDGERLAHRDADRGYPDEKSSHREPERYEGDRHDDYDDRVNAKGMQRWRGDDINGNIYRDDDRHVKMNGITSRDERREHDGKYDYENEEKVQQRLDREAEEERERKEAKIRQIHSNKGTFFVIGQQQQQQQQLVRKEDPSRDQSRYGVDDSTRHSNRDSESQWTRIKDGSNYSIYEAFIHGDRNHVVCASCGSPIRKSVAIYVSEMKRYWHDHCFHCVVCRVRFGSEEQRSPMKVTSSLLHCENCFITDEGERCTEV